MRPRAGLRDPRGLACGRWLTVLTLCYLPAAAADAEHDDFGTYSDGEKEDEFVAFQVFMTMFVFLFTLTKDADKEDDSPIFREMEVQVRVQSARVDREIKSEIEVLDDSETYVFQDGNMYEEGSEFYQEVEIGHPEITMYEVEEQENPEILCKVEDLKGEILYEVEDQKGEILYQDGQRAEILYEDGQTAEILYEGVDRSDIHYEEVYEESI